VVAEVALATGGSAAGGSPTTEVVRLVVAFASVLGAVVTSIVFAAKGRAANRVPGDILAERSPTDLAEALERAAELEEWPTELLP
jgi:hypothetical protein